MHHRLYDYVNMCEILSSPSDYLTFPVVHTAWLNGFVRCLQKNIINSLLNYADKSDVTMVT